jgi:hypothetical protein
MTTTSITHRSSAWLAIGALALAGLAAGCDRRGPTDPPPPSTTTSPSATTPAPMPPASAASN